MTQGIGGLLVFFVASIHIKIASSHFRSIGSLLASNYKNLSQSPTTTVPNSVETAIQNLGEDFQVGGICQILSWTRPSTNTIMALGRTCLFDQTKTPTAQSIHYIAVFAIVWTSSLLLS